MHIVSNVERGFSDCVVTFQKLALHSNASQLILYSLLVTYCGPFIVEALAQYSEGKI